MKGVLYHLLWGIILGLALPGLLLRLAGRRIAGAEIPTTETSETVSDNTAPQAALEVLYRDEDGTTTVMDMDEYLLGVVLAEMPTSFEPEALKAQAVAARTYARKAEVTGGKHIDGSVCGDPACCQAYISETDYLAQGGTALGCAKVRKAVEATSGYVLCYEGELIEATYFSCSGGSTEDAAAVWGTDYPYLRAVDSPGEEKATHFTSTVTLTPEEFQAALGIELEEPPEDWFHDVRFTAGGGVASIEIGDKRFTGTALRTVLGLDSTAFSMTADAEKITIITHGYGHRVGMSQYGADAMAVTGSTWQEILTHYYPGTEITLVER